jgi:hypothetical protein
MRWILVTFLMRAFVNHHCDHPEVGLGQQGNKVSIERSPCFSVAKPPEALPSVCDVFPVQNYRFIRTVRNVALLEVLQVAMKGQVRIVAHEATEKTQIAMAGFIRMPEYVIARFVNVEPIPLTTVRGDFPGCRLVSRHFIAPFTLSISSEL